MFPPQTDFVNFFYKLNFVHLCSVLIFELNDKIMASRDFRNALFLYGHQVEEI